MDQKDNDKNQPVSFDDKIDMSAFDDAINATAGDKPKVQHAIDVEKITLDNTPTTGAALEAQLSEDPDMNLGGSSDGDGEKKDDGKKEEDNSSKEEMHEDSSDENKESSKESTDATADEEIDLDKIAAESIDQPDVDVDVDVETPAEPVADDKKKEEAKAPKASLANMSLGDAAAKVSGSTKKALGAMKPKNTFGVVALSIGIGIVVLGIVVAVLFFTA